MAISQSSITVHHAHTHLVVPLMARRTAFESVQRCVRALEQFDFFQLNGSFPMAVSRAGDSSGFIEVLFCCKQIQIKEKVGYKYICTLTKSNQVFLCLL